MPNCSVTVIDYETTSVDCQQLLAMGSLSFYFGAFAYICGSILLLFSSETTPIFKLVLVPFPVLPTLIGCWLENLFSKFSKLFPRFEYRMIIGLIGLIITTGLQKYVVLNGNVKNYRDGNLQKPNENGLLPMSSGFHQVLIWTTCFSLFFFVIFATEAAFNHKVYWHRHKNIVTVITIMALFGSGVECWLLVSELHKSRKL